MDVRIGIIQAARELDLELGDEVNESELLASIESALAGESEVLWLTDRRGRRVGVPSARVAYIEIGAPDAGRRVGYGA